MSVYNPGLQGVPAGTRPEALNTTLRAAARRIRGLMLLRYGARALCWTALACLIGIGLSKLRLYETPNPWVFASILCLSLFIAAVFAFTRRLTELEVAQLTERRADLKERLSSAVEFQQQGIALDTPFYGEQLADADRYAAGVNVRALYPARIRWELPVGILATLALFLAYFLPTLPMFWSKQKQQEMAEVKKKGMEIVRLAQDTTKNADQQKLDETRKAAMEARKIGEAMQKGQMSKKEALVALQKLDKKIEEAQKQLAAPPAKKSLDMARKDFQKALDKMQQEREEAAKKDAAKAQAQNGKPRDMQKPQDTPKPNESTAMKQARAAMQQMADALANQDQQQMKQAMEKMAEAMQKGEMSKEEMQQMQQALQQLAQSLKDTNQSESAQQMEQMAEQMAQQMGQSNGDLDPKTLQKFAQQMKNIGQQMGKGQGQLAQMDAKELGNLVQMLKEGRMTMAMGNGKGKGQGGKGPGDGYFGSGDPKAAMKDPGATNPNLVAINAEKKAGGKGKSGSAEEFAQYVNQNAGKPGHLPNGKISGVRSENGNELQMSMTGDPEAAKSNSPYYQVVQSSKKQAESTLNKENIPASLKKQVKDYFDSIK